jgi:hypothetical protein
MGKYKIYHIPNVKIGVSVQLETRIANQGYKLDDVEILEEHDCITKASDREIELQKQYGYKVDFARYDKSVKYGPRTEEVKKKISDAQKGRAMTWGHKTSKTLKDSGIVRGVNNPRAKLTEKEVLEIRSKYKPHRYTKPMLAKEYNVSGSLISQIIDRGIWNHI